MSHHETCPTCGKPYEEKRSRSTEQNKWMWKVIGEISEQKGDMTPREVHQMLKLMFGVPVMCASDERFRASWSRLAKRLTHEEQLELMDYYAVTSEMNTSQFTQFIADVFHFFTQQGFRLTHPDDRGLYDADHDRRSARTEAVRRDA